MADKSVLARIREFLDSLGSDGDDTPDLDAPQGEEGSDIRADDAPTDDAENIPDDGTDDGTDGTNAEGAADDNGEDAGESEDEETMPDSDAELAQLRDSCTVLATENERLRTILTDNGIDFEGNPEIEAAVEEADSDDAEADEYDDEAAQADIDAVKTRNAQWDK